MKEDFESSSDGQSRNSYRRNNLLQQEFMNARYVGSDFCSFSHSSPLKVKFRRDFKNSATCVIANHFYKNIENAQQQSTKKSHTTSRATESS